MDSCFRFSLRVGKKSKGDTPLESPFRRGFTPLGHPKTVRE